MATLVRQREEMDCGIATVANAVGWSYESVRFAAESEGLFDGGPISVDRLVRLLAACTGHAWESRALKPYRPFRERLAGEGLPGGCPILVRHPVCDDPGHWTVYKGHRVYYGPCHWIAIRGGRVLDPYLGRPMTPNRYGYAHWDVLRVLSPRAADEGDAGRGRSAR